MTMLTRQAILETRRLDAPRRERLRQEQLAGIRYGLAHTPQGSERHADWAKLLQRFNVACAEGAGDE